MCTPNTFGGTFISELRNEMLKNQRSQEKLNNIGRPNAAVVKRAVFSREEMNAAFAQARTQINVASGNVSK